MKRVTVGIIGSGFSANLHAEAYRKVRGVEVEIAGVSSKRIENSRKFAQRHKIEKAFDDHRHLLDDPRIDVVDLCVPNSLHKPLAVEVAEAGKHIICEKPLTAFCGEEMAEDVGLTTPRAKMLGIAVRNAGEMNSTAQANGVKLMYAENWIYAPSVQKARRLIQASSGTILDIRAEESHSGSHSPFSKKWKHTGGGSLIRMGSHPIGAALYLKMEEARARGMPPIFAKSVTAEVANLTKLGSFESRWTVSDWEDVEDWATAIITFSDGTKATIVSTDVVLGGVQNRMEIYLSNARVNCHINPNNSCIAYAPDPGIFGDEYIVEKIETKAGWTFPSPDEDWMTGYPQEIQDFVECVAFDKEPISDGKLGEEVVKVIYSAYLSAEREERVEVEQACKGSRLIEIVSS